MVGRTSPMGHAIGKHDAVAQKLAFISGSTFGLEAVVDVSSRLADDKKNDIRIEAAIAKLHASELGWRVID
jgi:alkylation response protein AidB-like acyl-CoA dehydrogenase